MLSAAPGWRRRKENGSKTYKALGSETPSFGFIEARAAALKWFADKDRGISSDRNTVSDACKSYVEDREREKGKTCAQDAKMTCIWTLNSGARFSPQAAARFGICSKPRC
jgi:hypothetical protein